MATTLVKSPPPPTQDQQEPNFEFIPTFWMPKLVNQN